MCTLFYTDIDHINPEDETERLVVTFPDRFRAYGPNRIQGLGMIGHKVLNSIVPRNFRIL
jgi:hypothetical protein